MIQYNVTITIDASVEEDWLQWMCDVHIPDVMSTGLFLSYRISKLIKHDQEEPSYTIQYIAECMADMHEYQRRHAARLQKEHTSRYQGKFAGFRTLMEVISSS